jgi:hypothetical protein
MGLWDRFVGRGGVDLLEWVEPPSRDALAVRHMGLRLKDGDAVLVRPGQACVVGAGEVADVLGPGRYHLGASVLPKLTGANVIRGAGGAFRGDVSFVSLEPHLNVPWATVASVVVRDDNNVNIPAKASGEFGFVVYDPAAFVRELVPAGDTTGATRADVATLMAGQFGEIFRTGGLDCADLLGPTGRLGLVAGEILATTLRGMGVALLRFTVKTLTVAAEVRRPRSPLGADGVDGYRADAPAPLFSKVALPPSPPTAPGLPALPAELADILEPPLPRQNGPKSTRIPLVNDAPEDFFASRQMNTGPKSEGFPVGSTAAESENGSTSGNLFDIPTGPTPQLRTVDPPIHHPARSHDHAPAVHPPGPPPLPATLAFHVSINGTPVGPFDMIVLNARVRDGSLGRKTLVWRPGFESWVAAEHVPELAILFPEPPQPPPQ